MSNLVYPYYEKMFPDVLKQRNQLEEGIENPAPLVEYPLQLLKEQGEEAVVKYQTEASLIRSNMMMSAWTHLFEYLMVKHLDMATKQVEENDPLLNRFKKTENGLSQAPARPGYPEAFRKQIIRETGNKYLLPE